MRICCRMQEEGRAIEKKDQCDGDMCVVLLLCGFLPPATTTTAIIKTHFPNFCCAQSRKREMFMASKQLRD